MNQTTSMGPSQNQTDFLFSCQRGRSPGLGVILVHDHCIPITIQKMRTLKEGPEAYNPRTCSQKQRCPLHIFPEETHDHFPAVVYMVVFDIPVSDVNSSTDLLVADVMGKQKTGLTAHAHTKRPTLQIQPVS